MRISDWSSDVCSSDLQNAGGRKAGEIVDMAVGMVVEQSVTQPQQPFDAQIVGKPGLDLPFRHAGIAIGVEQALFGDRKSGGEGKSVSVRVDLGGRRIIKKKK